MSLFIGEQRLAILPSGLKQVVIRKITGNYVTVSLGFDTKGNDITCIIPKYDIAIK